MTMLVAIMITCMHAWLSCSRVCYKNNIIAIYFVMQDDDLHEIILDNEAEEDEDPKGSISWKLRAILIFLLVWQFNFGISDAAVTAIVCFLYKIFNFMHVKFTEQTKQPAAEEFPKTLKKACQLVGIKMNSFIEYMVCPKCNAVYDHEFGYTIQDNQKVPVKCPNIEYPYHPHMSRWKLCGLSLK